MREIKKQFKKLRKITPPAQWQDSQWDSLLSSISDGKTKQLTSLEKVSCFMSNPGIFRPVGNLVAIVLVVVMGSWGMVTSAENTAHGDLLYPVKKVMERVSLAITVDDSARVQKQTAFVSKRLFELNNLAIRLEYSSVSEQSLDRTVNDLKKEIVAVHDSLRQVQATGSADDIYALTTHVEETTNQLNEKIARTAESLPVDVTFSMDDLIEEAEALVMDTNNQLLEVIVSQDLSDGAVSEDYVIQRLEDRVAEVTTDYNVYNIDSWKNQYYIGDEEMQVIIAGVDELSVEVEETLTAITEQFVEKDYVGILAATNHVQYLISQIDLAMYPPAVKGVEEVEVLEEVIHEEN